LVGSLRTTVAKIAAAAVTNGIFDIGHSSDGRQNGAISV